MLEKLRKRQNSREVLLQNPAPAHENPTLANTAELDLLLKDISSRKVESDNFYYFPISKGEMEILEAGCSVKFGSGEDARRLRNIYTHRIISNDLRKHTHNGSRPA